jgi:hypothetical protein
MFEMSKRMAGKETGWKPVCRDRRGRLSSQMMMTLSSMTYFGVLIFSKVVHKVSSREWTLYWEEVNRVPFVILQWPGGKSLEVISLSVC